MKQVEILQSSKCFLMIGVNDLIDGRTVEEVLTNDELLLQGLAGLGETVGLETYVQSVLPVREGQTCYPIANGEVRQLNEGIAALAERNGMPLEMTRGN